VPAPSPQSLGYSGDSSNPWVERKAPIDVAAETGGAVNEIQRLLESLQEEDAPPPVDSRNQRNPQVPDLRPSEDVPTGPLPPVRLRAPIVNATMPRGAFP
jgi:hypothetical protein